MFVDRKGRNQQSSKCYIRFQIDQPNGMQNFLLSRSIEVSSPKLIGNFSTDINGRNLVMDGCEGIRVYTLPVERLEQIPNKDSDNEDVVDDWEQLVDKVTKCEISRTSLSSTEIIIPNCCDLEFDLLKGYIPMNVGGNQVGFSDKNRDRTAGMRWMVKNHQKLKCDDGTRLFDIDFFAGNENINFMNMIVTVMKNL